MLNHFLMCQSESRRSTEQHFDRMSMTQKQGHHLLVNEYERKSLHYKQV